MNFLMLARVAKLVALLGFILPWVVVSCSGTEILQATGIQLMTGDLQPTAAFEQAQAQGQAQPSGEGSDENLDPSIPAIAAFAAIAIGLLLSLVTKGRAAAGAIMITAIAGLGLSYYAVDKLGADLASSMEQSSGQSQSQSDNPFASGGPSPSQMPFQVEEKEGYWLTMGALGAALILALLMLGAAAPATATRQDPPPNA